MISGEMEVNYFASILLILEVKFGYDSFKASGKCLSWKQEDTQKKIYHVLFGTIQLQQRL